MLIHHPITYLALGDSYTIGEGLPLHDSFSYQLVQLLRQNGQHTHAPEIIAQTGWTTQELATHLIHTQLEASYDWVSLLAGVNNQYRGLSLDEFAEEYEFLIHKAIHLAKTTEKGVFTITIPDWTVTPFGLKDTKEVSREPIAAFNAQVKRLSEKHGIRCVDISASCSQAAQTESGLCKDGLHYSAATHGDWCKLIMETIFHS
ncbi:MAG: SGNH/GDSL hydrolase family protein [Bacteroidetes bacterium]|nr:SGNH/GDSL hydrolase family protein [Bacteroidota bacterium]